MTAALASNFPAKTTARPIRLTASDRELLSEHVVRLFELASTHREFAASRGDHSNCGQTKASALAAAKRTERLAILISDLVSERTGYRAT